MLKFFSFAAIAFLSLTAALHADFRYNVQSGTFFSDGVNPTTGSVRVFVDSTTPGTDFPGPGGTGGPNIALGYQASLQASGLSGISSVNFLGATTTSTPLYPSSPFTITSAGPLSVSNALGDLGLNPSLFNNAGLFNLNFSVPAGQTGSFNLSFLDTPGFPSDLSTFGGDIVTQFQGGTITISSQAVPEPSSLMLLASGIGALALRRRRK